VSNDIVEVYIK